MEKSILALEVFTTIFGAGLDAVLLAKSISINSGLDKEVLLRRAKY